MEYPSEKNNFLSDHIALLLTSYQSLTGQQLIVKNSYGEIPAKALFYESFALLSHGIESNPIFNYANQKALELFGYEWDELISLPSKLSAEPVHQNDRERLLAEVNQKGYISNYQGIRISKSGRRFLIKNAIVWNLFDDQGHLSGQAAKFEHWQYL